MARQYDSKPTHRDKSAEDLKQEGITLIKNAFKAKAMSEPLLDTYFCGSAESSDVNWACYLTQQAFELSLKGLIKYYGEDFREGHFVRYNAQMLADELSGPHPELREINDILVQLQGKYSVILFKWESISRYKDLHVTQNNIVDLTELLDQLIKFLRRHNYVE